MSHISLNPSFVYAIFLLLLLPLIVIGYALVRLTYLFLARKKSKDQKPKMIFFDLVLLVFLLTILALILHSWYKF